VRELVTPHIKRRLKKKGIQKYVKIKAECYLKKEKEGEDKEKEEGGTGGAGAGGGGAGGG
jgi:hypothetical protein